MTLMRRLKWIAGCMALCLAGVASHAHAVDLIGYIPYYRMDDAYPTTLMPAQLGMLDEVRYFGLTTNSSGTIVTMDPEVEMATHVDYIEDIKTAINELPANQRPRLNITLGGAGASGSFSTVAASDSLRTTLANNIASFLTSTGATSVDIDWEHPATFWDGCMCNERTSSYPALISKIKEKVGTDRSVYATLDPTVMVSTSMFSGDFPVDGVSLMTYDLGWWGNDPGNPNTGEHSLHQYVVDSANAWTEPPGSPNDRSWVFGAWGRNVPEELVGVGMPFYGRNISNGADYTYAELQNAHPAVTGNYYTHGGGSVWALNPAMAADRVQFAHDEGLQHIIIWEMAQDLAPTHADSLLKAAYERKLLLEPPVFLYGDYNGNDIVDAADYGVWRDSLSAGATSLLNDPTPGAVDASDFTYWRAHFGETLGGGAGAAQAIPEPSTMAALGIALGLLTVTSRCSRSGRSSLRPSNY